MIDPQTIYQVSGPGGQDLIRINDAGDFFVRGEEVASTSIIRDAFLDYARLYVQENLATKTLIAIKSTVPRVLHQFPTDELRATPEFTRAMLAAQMQPELVFQYDGNDLHIHVLVGVMQEMIAELLQQKRVYEHGQGLLAARQHAEQAVMDASVEAIALEAEVLPGFFNQNVQFIDDEEHPSAGPTSPSPMTPSSSGDEVQPPADPSTAGIPGPLEATTTPAWPAEPVMITSLAPAVSPSTTDVQGAWNV